MKKIQMNKSCNKPLLKIMSFFLLIWLASGITFSGFSLDIDHDCRGEETLANTNFS